MRWLLSEYLLKGIFLGVLLFVAVQKLDWQATGIWAAAIAGGLIIGVGIAAWRKLGEGYRVTGRLPAFILFLILESPILVYAGVLIGSTGGALVLRKPGMEEWFPLLFAGGALLGLLFWLLRHVADRWFRVALSFALAAALVGGTLYWLDRYPEFLEDPAIRTMFGLQLLLGIPLFYLLTFAGVAEESEVEIGAVCAALGVGLWAITRDRFQQPAVCFAVPLVLYFVYTTRILPGLRVFKHVVRGIGYANVAQYRPALLAFHRALQLDPNNALAREHLWALHRQIDLRQLAQDPQTLALVDLDLCLERATALLLQPNPDAEKLKEAHHLLDLVVSQRPAAATAVCYWRAVAWTHARQFDQAAAELGTVLDPSGSRSDDGSRNGILFSAWQLALALHPELNRRIGTPQLAQPGRRIDAIAAVERKLAQNPDDADAWTLKRLLYSGLTEKDYLETLRTLGKAQADASENFEFAGLEHFDHGYSQQLGLALVDDPARRERGIEYLRIAARGLPAQGPTLFVHIARAYEQAGNATEALNSYELAKRAGRVVGPSNLGEEDRKAYFATVKYLGETARARSDLAAAIENYLLYAEYDRSGLETLRILADLYEKKGEALSALRYTEQALLYDGKDADLRERKDRYYYSVMPQDLEANLDRVRGFFDVTYCQQKAKTLLDFKDADAGLIEWAEHLAELAQIVQPASAAAKVLRARALRRRGELDQARELLSSARDPRPERFASSAEEEAWYLSCRLLGELYLYDLARPDLAVPCFNDFRQSHKSGADTLYKLGQAYEQLGDRARAIKFYEHVSAYESHPLAPDAREALYRLQSQA